MRKQSGRRGFHVRGIRGPGGDFGEIASRIEIVGNQDSRGRVRRQATGSGIAVG
jgi:hypothetical protein